MKLYEKNLKVAYFLDRIYKHGSYPFGYWTPLCTFSFLSGIYNFLNPDGTTSKTRSSKQNTYIQVKQYTVVVFSYNFQKGKFVANLFSISSRIPATLGAEPK